MHRNEAITVLNQRRANISQYGVRSIALFGSTARDEARPTSDVDILVEFQDSPTYDQFMDLKFYLESILQHKVDLVTKKAVKSKLRPYIEKDLIYVT